MMWKMDVAQAEMSMDTFFALTYILPPVTVLILLCLLCNAATSSLAHAGCNSSARGLMLGASRAPWSRLATACSGSASLGRVCQCTNRSVPWRLVAAVSSISFCEMTLNPNAHVSISQHAFSQPSGLHVEQHVPMIT